MFWTRFIELCNETGKSPNAVATTCGVKSSGTVTGWSKGSIPRTPVLRKMANYFGVTVDYLLGNVSEPFLFLDKKGLLQIDDVVLVGKKEKPLTYVDERLLDEQLIQRLCSLTPEELGKVDAFVQGLIASR